MICELNFNSAILAVKLNRKRIVVMLEEQVHIYDISTMKSLHVIDIPSNSKGLVALSPSLENPYLVYPANLVTGKVNIFDAVTLQDVNIVHAHKMPVTCLSLNYDGDKLATASEKAPSFFLLFLFLSVFPWCVRCSRALPRTPFCNATGNCYSGVLCARRPDVVPISPWELPDHNLLALL